MGVIFLRWLSIKVMKINTHISFFIMCPALIQLFLFYLCINVSQSMFLYSLFYLGSLFLLSVFFELLCLKKINYAGLYDKIYLRVSDCDKFVLILFGFFVILMLPLDVFFNGFKIINPASYAEFYGPGRYIRHVINLCWMLVPIAYAINNKNKWVARFFILFSILIPILVIDRNRLLMSFFCLLFILYIRFRSTSIRNNPREFIKVKRRIYLLGISIPMIFIVIGFYRSGSSFDIESSGELISYGKYPLTDFFEMMPASLKQLLLYIISPLLNFSHIASSDFINEQFLLSQFSPFSRDLFPAYPYAPVLIERYNVGTEFYPFLLFGGVFYVFFAMFIVVLIYYLVFCWFCESTGFYSWLLFLKFTYLILFLGFAPQFFILLNIISSLVILALFLISRILKETVVIMTK